MGIYHMLLAKDANGKGSLDPTITEKIVISKRRAMSIALKYVNCIIANNLILYIFHGYSVPFQFVNNDDNHSLISQCTPWWNGYLMPYKKCSFNEMFERPSLYSAHVIRNITACLPNYLFGRQVYLQGFSYAQQDYPVEVELSGSNWNMKVLFNIFLIMFLPAILVFFEETKLYNKLMLEAKNFGRVKFYCRSLLMSLAYFLVVESAAFGSTNLLSGQECMTSLYSPNNKLKNQALATGIISAIECVPVAAMFYGAFSSGEGFLKGISTVSVIAIGFLAMAGITSLILTATLDPAFIVKFPSTLSIPEVSFYDGSICKMMSLILAFAYIAETFISAPVSLLKKGCSFPTFFSRSRPQATTVSSADLVVDVTNPVSSTNSVLRK